MAHTKEQVEAEIQKLNEKIEALRPGVRAAKEAFSKAKHDGDSKGLADARAEMDRTMNQMALLKTDRQYLYAELNEMQLRAQAEPQPTPAQSPTAQT